MNYIRYLIDKYCYGLPDHITYQRWLSLKTAEEFHEIYQKEQKERDGLTP
jgi:hypothetical protein